MKWLLALLTIIGEVLGLLKRKQSEAHAAEVKQEGETAQKATIQGQVLHDVAQAQLARDAVDQQLAAHPDSLREDDGFRRPD